MVEDKRFQPLRKELISALGRFLPFQSVEAC
jgi:hypothetical protein